MDIRTQIEDLAVNFDACHKTLTAMGDETRQHIILEMMLICGKEAQQTKLIQTAAPCYSVK